MDYTNVECPS